jgi:putative MATE family efflux protein
MVEATFDKIFGSPIDKHTSKQAKAEGRAKLLLEGPILTSMLMLAGPLLLIGVLNSANTLIGAVCVGHLGGAAVAAVALSFPVTFFCLAIGTSFSVPGSTLIAQYFGARNQAMINKVAAQCMMMAAIVSAGLALIGLVAAPLILDLMGASDDVHHLATAYLHVALCATIFSFPMIMCQAIMRALGDPRLPLYLIVGTILLSLLVVPAFVFGFGPIPAFGVTGAALAQLVTQAIALSVAVTAMLSGRIALHLRKPDFVLDLPLVRRIFLLGVPASAEIALRGLGVMSITVIAAQFGTLAVASYGVVNNMLQLVNVPATALSLSVAILAGQSIGAGNLERARRIGRIGLTFGFSLMTVLALAAFVLAHAFVAFFVPKDGAVI